MTKQMPLHRISLDTCVFNGLVTCDRCGIRANVESYIVSDYLVDNIIEATGALCPNCAIASDSNHFNRSWLLIWGY